MPTKYVIVIPDGAADEPQDSLGGKTPLQAAKLPAMDAWRGRVSSAGRETCPTGSCRPATWPR